jgi:SAM-dependent methyltransferase
MASSDTLNDWGEVSARVRRMYDDYGWSEEDGVTHDADACEDLRAVAAPYVSACRLRCNRPLTGGDRILDFGSGPIQYPEYLTYSEKYDKRVCVDLSARGLEGARTKLGDRGEYHCGNILELDLPENGHDAVVSLHVLYHNHKDVQATIVRRLLSLVRPGKPVVIVYSNPAYLPAATAGRVRRWLRPPGDDQIYFYRHPLSWWRQFEDAAEVAITPWRSLTTRDQKLFVRSRKGFERLWAFEEAHPALAVKLANYPMITLTKR